MTQEKLGYKPLNILFISTFFPSQGISAGAGRVFSLIKTIAEYHKITLIYLCSDDEKKEGIADLKKYCQKIYPVIRNYKNNFLRKTLLNPPWFITEHESPEIRKLIKKKLKENNYDIIQVEFLEVCCNLPSRVKLNSILTHHELKTPCLWEDFKNEKITFKKIKLFIKCLAMFIFELRCCQYFKTIVTINDQEGLWLKKFLPGVVNVDIPMWVDTDLFVPQKLPIEPNSIVYVGHFEHSPNVDAVLYLVKEIIPLIKIKIPNIKLYIVGSYPVKEIKKFDDQKHIIVAGKVPDICPYLAEAAVFVAPIRKGGGMRGKILEAMAMGKAVVTTTRGVSGLDAQKGKEIVIADNAEDFAKEVVDLMLNNERRERIGQAALKLVRSRYDIKSQVYKYLDLYEKIIQNSR